MPKLRVPALVGGEFAPSLWGRTDLDRFRTSVARMENFIPVAEGGAKFRPGTDYVAACRENDRKTRLETFKFNEDQAYSIEFGHQYLRILGRVDEVSGHVVGDTWAITGGFKGTTTYLQVASLDYDELPVLGGHVEVWGIGAYDPSHEGVWEALPVRDGAAAAGGMCAVVSAEFNEGSGLFNVRVFTETAHGLSVGDVVSIKDIDPAKTNLFAALDSTQYRVAAVESVTTLYIDIDVGVAEDSNGTDVPPATLPWLATCVRPHQTLLNIAYNSNGEAGNPSSGYLRHFVQIDTPWTEDDIFGLEFDQSADVMTITHRDYQPRELKRHSHEQWELSPIWFYPRMRGPISVVPSDIAKDDAYPPTAPTFYAYSYGHYALEYEVTAFSADTGEESIGTYTYYVGAGNNFLRRDEWERAMCLLTWEVVPGASGYNIYKRDIFGTREYGFIGYVKATLGATQETFEDRQRSSTLGTSLPRYPDWGDNPPPRNPRNPFGISDGTDDCPRAVAIFQQRRFFAGVDEQPQGVFSSRSAAYSNFNTTTPQTDNSAITAIIAAQQINPILHLVKMRKLLLLTSGGEWYVEGDEVGALTPTSFQPIPQTEYGSCAVKPLMIGGAVLFVEGNKRRIRDLAYEYSTDSYQGNELTVMARHLFDDFEIIDWCYAQSPNSLVHVVRSDGVLLTLTYLREHQVWAWARHSTSTAISPSRIESVCSVPEGDDDGVYVVVRRYIGETTDTDTGSVQGSYVRYIERFRAEVPLDPLRPDIEKQFEPMHLDSAMSFYGPEFPVLDVVYTASGARICTDTNSRVFDDSFPVYIALTPDNCAREIGGWWTARVVIVGVGAAGRITLHQINEAVLDGTTALDFNAISEYLSATHQLGAGEDRYHMVRAPHSRTVSGLDHLEGEMVGIVGDGNHLGDQVVGAGGTVGQIDDVGADCWTIHVGLRYEGTIETLPLHSPDGMLAGKKFSVPEVTIESYNARGFKIGPVGADDNDLRTYPERSRGYMYTADTGPREDVIDIEPGWGQRGRLKIKHTAPVACEILSITPKVVVDRED